MKVEVNISKDSLIIVVYDVGNPKSIEDGVQLNVYDELGQEIVKDAVKKSVWLASVAYEINRRLYRLIEVEKKAYMAHWREWAIKWSKVKGMKDTMDIVDSCVSKIFGDCSIGDKVQFVFDIRGVHKKNIKIEKWPDFFNNDDIDDAVKKICRDMYRLELEKKMTYDRVIDLESRMQTIVSSLRAAADGYKRKSEQEKQLKF
jgi:hypothetical protein